jgi:hypothetical protein
VQPSPEPSPVRVALEVEEDPTPLVGLVAGGLRARLADPEFADRVAVQAAVGVIRDTGTPQAVTASFESGTVRLQHGADPAAAATLAIDLSGAEPEPEVSGAEENGELVELLGALLEPPPVEWREAAAEFWRVAGTLRGGPASLLVRETESGEAIVLGGDEPAGYEIHGTAEALCTVFAGHLPLAEAVVQGVVHVRGSLCDLSLLTGACFAIMTGGNDE